MAMRLVRDTVVKPDEHTMNHVSHTYTRTHARTHAMRDDILCDQTFLLLSTHDRHFSFRNRFTTQTQTIPQTKDPVLAEQSWDPVERCNVD